MDALAAIHERTKDLYPGLLGVKFVAVDKDAVAAEITVREELCTVPGILHGGVIMGFADTLGAVGTVMNLPEGAITTTVESKTNFFRAVRLGETLRGETAPLHRGKRTMVWQTRLTDAEGKLVAMVTQTQIVLPGAGGE